MTKDTIDIISNTIKNKNSCMLYHNDKIIFTEIIDNLSDLCLIIPSILSENLDDLSQLITFTFIENAKHKISYDKLNVYINKNRKIQNFEKVIDGILEIIDDKQLCLIIEDFDYLLKNKEDMWKLRAFLQENKRVNIIATSKQERVTSYTSKHPFFKFFSIMKMEDNSKNNLISNILSMGYSLNAKQICYLTNRLKSEADISLLAKLILPSQKVLVVKEASNEVLAEAIIELITIKEELYMEKIIQLREIKHGLNVFKNFNIHKNSTNNNTTLTEKNYSRIIRVLAKKRFIKKEHHGVYSSRDQLFVDYILRKISKENIIAEIKNSVNEQEI